MTRCYQEYLLAPKLADLGVVRPIFCPHGCDMDSLDLLLSSHSVTAKATEPARPKDKPMKGNNTLS